MPRKVAAQVAGVPFEDGAAQAIDVAGQVEPAPGIARAARGCAPPFRPDRRWPGVAFHGYRVARAPAFGLTSSPP